MKVKRTHNLDAATVATVRELVEQRQLMPRQDVLGETALADFFMAAWHADEARHFAAAARDREVADEIATLERAFQTAVGETWPA